MPVCEQVTAKQCSASNLYAAVAKLKMLLKIGKARFRKQKMKSKVSEEVWCGRVAGWMLPRYP